MNKTVVRKRYINNNTIESQRSSIGGAIVQQISDNAKGMASDAWSQLLGPLVGEKGLLEKTGGDLSEGQELVLKKPAQNHVSTRESIRHPDIKPGVDYIREILDAGKKSPKEDIQKNAKQIEEILIELKRLIASTKELQMEFKEVTVQTVVNPGKYHLNFFEWLLSVIRLARMKVEDSGAWLSAFKSKKAKREYWAMFKKHGTTFGLSNERVVATQTG